MGKKMAGTVCEMLGTCVSIGCTVDGEDPKDIQQQIKDGELDIPDFEAPPPAEEGK
jgi:large subunit ribosomal protein L12e